MPRKDFRVDDTLPFDYSDISKGDVKDDAACSKSVSDILHGDIDLKGTDAEVLKLLKAIDNKLNHVLQALNQDDIVTRIPSPKKVNISASGIRFQCKEELAKGDSLKIILGLPPFPYNILSLIGEVVRSEKPDNEDGVRYIVAVKFINLKDGTTDEIMQYLLEAQRKNINKDKDI